MLSCNKSSYEKARGIQTVSFEKNKKDLVTLKSDVIKLDIDEQVNLKQKDFHKI